MGKRLFVLCWLLVIFTSGCGKNNNIFSWAHRSNSDSYESLMSEADLEIRNGDYAKAAKHYEMAAIKRRGDKNAVMKRVSASITDALGSNLQGIATYFSSDNYMGVLSKFTALPDETRTKMNEVLRNAVDNKDMFPSVFENGNPPIDTSINIDGAIVYFLAGIFVFADNPKVRQEIKQHQFNDINNLFISVLSDGTAVKSSEVRSMIYRASKARRCLDNIKSPVISPAIEQQKLKLNEFINYVQAQVK